MVVGTLRVATRLQVEFRLHNSVPSRRHAKGTSLLGSPLHDCTERTIFLEFEPNPAFCDGWSFHLLGSFAVPGGRKTQEMLIIAARSLLLDSCLILA